jgi:hypothetical protein
MICMECIAVEVYANLVSGNIIFMSRCVLRTGIATSVKWLYEVDVWSSILGKARYFFSPPALDQLWGPTQLISVATGNVMYVLLVVLKYLFGGYCFVTVFYTWIIWVTNDMSHFSYLRNVVEPGGSFPGWQEPSTGPHPQVGESSPHPHIVCNLF